jgi:hypothetical protein
VCAVVSGRIFFTFLFLHSACRFELPSRCAYSLDSSVLTFLSLIQISLTFLLPNSQARHSAALHLAAPVRRNPRFPSPLVSTLLSLYSWLHQAITLYDQSRRQRFLPEVLSAAFCPPFCQSSCQPIYQPIHQHHLHLLALQLQLDRLTYLLLSCQRYQTPCPSLSWCAHRKPPLPILFHPCPSQLFDVLALALLQCPHVVSITPLTSQVESEIPLKISSMSMRSSPTVVA